MRLKQTIFCWIPLHKNWKIRVNGAWTDLLLNILGQNLICRATNEAKLSQVVGGFGRFLPIFYIYVLLIHIECQF